MGCDTQYEDIEQWRRRQGKSMPAWRQRELQERMQFDEDVRRAKEAMLARARKMTKPFRRQKFERKVADKLGIDRYASRLAFGDLLINQVFRLYNSEGGGDSVSNLS